MRETLTRGQKRAAPGRPLRILLVEDNPADAELCLFELRKGGFEVCADVVETRDEFAQRLSSDNFDLVLADYNLRGWTGMDALAVLKERGLDIPLILVTGALGDELAVDCIKKGAADCIIKDRLARLPVAVGQVLEEKARITERKLAQRRLEERTTYLTALIENSPLGICILDQQFRLKMCNPAFEQLLDYQHAEIAGGDAAELIVPSELRSETAELRQRVEAGETVHLTTRRLRRDGTLVDVELHAVPLRAGEERLGSFAIYQDITERKRAEAERLRALELKAANEALALADQRKSEFLADMSHELRTPLNSVLGYSELLLDDSDGLDPKYREGLSVIYDKGQHLLALVNDLLDLARIESGQAMLECCDISVSDQCLRTLDTFAPRLREKNLRYTVEVEPPGLTVCADPRRLEQVLTNLVANAVRFTERGGITLRAHPRDHRVELCVEDTGVGIAPNDLEHIFDKFYQAHRRAEGASRGVGLGLTITKQLVELQGGEIWVESTPGQGTRFFFTLPRALPVPNSLPPEEPTHD